MEARRLHSFYLLKDSFLPILVSFNLLMIISGIVEMFESSVFLGDNITWFGFFNIFFLILFWISEYKNEWHNEVYGSDISGIEAEATNVRIGFFLFIISEVMFFFSFFFYTFIIQYGFYQNFLELFGQVQIFLCYHLFQLRYL